MCHPTFPSRHHTLAPMAKQLAPCYTAVLAFRVQCAVGEAEAAVGPCARWQVQGMLIPLTAVLSAPPEVEQVLVTASWGPGETAAVGRPEQAHNSTQEPHSGWPDSDWKRASPGGQEISSGHMGG